VYWVENGGYDAFADGKMEHIARQVNLLEVISFETWDHEELRVSGQSQINPQTPSFRYRILRSQFLLAELYGMKGIQLQMLMAHTIMLYRG